MNRQDRIDKVINAMICMQRQCWEQGVGSQALLAVGKSDLAVLFAMNAVVRQDEAGRLGVIETPIQVTDYATNGDAVLYAAKTTGDRSFALAAKKMEEWLLKEAPRTDEGIYYQLSDRNQLWADSFYMTPPFFSLMGKPEEAMKQIRGLRKALWNKEKKLYSHMWDADKKTFIRKDFWGGGNGWAAAAFAKVIGLLPENMRAEKEELAGYLKELLDGCLVYMRTGGLFHDVIDNEDTFVETNLSQMLAYSIYTAVREGWLDKFYLTFADIMRNAAYSKVDKFGLVQGACGSPLFNRSGTSTEAQAFFLMMEAAHMALESINK